MITQCCMEALYQTNDQEAIQLAKSFERRKCGHIPHKNTNTKTKFEENDNSNDDKNIEKDNTKKEEENTGDSRNDESKTTDNEEVKKDNKKPKKVWIEDNSTKTPGACLWKVVAVDKTVNKHRYVVATQDYRLRARLRKIPAVPLIYLNRSVMILEPMSEATKLAREEMEHKKLVAGLNSVPNLKRKLGEDGEGLGVASNLIEDEMPVKKKKRAKGPHPLSCLKKKKKPTSSTKENVKENSTESKDSKEKKKRRRAHHKRKKDDDNSTKQ